MSTLLNYMNLLVSTSMLGSTKGDETFESQCIYDVCITDRAITRMRFMLITL